MFFDRGHLSFGFTKYTSQIRTHTMSNKFQVVMKTILPSQMLREKTMSFQFLFYPFKVLQTSYIYWEFVPFSYETHHEGSVISSRSMRLGIPRSVDLILDLRNLKYFLKYVGTSPFNILHPSLSKKALLICSNLGIVSSLYHSEI